MPQVGQQADRAVHQVGIHLTADIQCAGLVHGQDAVLHLAAHERTPQLQTGVVIRHDACIRVDKVEIVLSLQIHGQPDLTVSVPVEHQPRQDLMGGIVQLLECAGGVREARHAMPVAAVYLGKVIQRHFIRADVPAGAASALTERQLQVKAEVVIHRDQAVLQRAVADRSVPVQRQGAVLIQLPVDGRRVAVQHKAARTVLFQLNVVFAQIVNAVHGHPLVEGQNRLADVLAHGGFCLAGALTAAGRQRQRHHQRQKQRRQFFHAFHHRSSCFYCFLLLFLPV